MDKSNYLMDVRSEEVQELLSREPTWFLRWSITIVLLVVALLFSAAWAIHYPDIVHASFTLTSINAPKPVVARTNGALIELFVEESDTVAAGATVAYVESTASHKEVLALAKKLATAWQFTVEGKLSDLSALKLTHYHKMGELQSDYQKFVQTYIQLQAYLPNGFYDQKRSVIKQEQEDLYALSHNLEQQRQLLALDQRMASGEFKVQQRLAQQQVIAELELKHEESKLIARRLPYQQAASAVINNRYTQRSKQKEILELDKQVVEQRAIFLQALNSLQSSLDIWQTKYVVRAPIKGRVLFARPLQRGEQVTNEQELFFIIPPGTKYEGRMNVPQKNSGKVKIGQDVLIKLTGYPYQEFGLVHGKISAIAELPLKDSVFLAKVKLPNGLVTTYGRRLMFKPGMNASAEIITQDSRLLDRIFYQVRALLIGNK